MLLDTAGAGQRSAGQRQLQGQVGNQPGLRGIPHLIPHPPGHFVAPAAQCRQVLLFLGGQARFGTRFGFQLSDGGFQPRMHVGTYRGAAVRPCYNPFLQIVVAEPYFPVRLDPVPGDMPIAVGVGADDGVGIAVVVFPVGPQTRFRSVSLGAGSGINGAHVRTAEVGAADRRWFFRLDEAAGVFGGTIGVPGRAAGVRVRPIGVPIRVGRRVIPGRGGSRVVIVVIAAKAEDLYRVPPMGVGRRTLARGALSLGRLLPRAVLAFSLVLLFGFSLRFLLFFRALRFSIGPVTWH